MSETFQVILPLDLAEQIDKERGFESRSSHLRRIIADAYGYDIDEGSFLWCEECHGPPVDLEAQDDISLTRHEDEVEYELHVVVKRKEEGGNIATLHSPTCSKVDQT